MNPLSRTCLIAPVLASLAAGLVALATPALASAMPPPEGGGYAPGSAQTLSSSGYEGMPAAWVREALLHGQDLAPASGSGSVPSSAATAVTRTVVLGGMPGWQIALITIGAALLAAAAAVLLDRTWAARRRPDSSIRPAASIRSGQPDEDREFPYGLAETIGDDADLIGTADLAVPGSAAVRRGPGQVARPYGSGGPEQG